MAAAADEAQSLKDMLRKPGKPVSIEEMNQLSRNAEPEPAKRGTAISLAQPTSRPL
jgi:hypothetical protein